MSNLNKLVELNRNIRSDSIQNISQEVRGHLAFIADAIDAIIKENSELEYHVPVVKKTGKFVGLGRRNDVKAKSHD